MKKEKALCLNGNVNGAEPGMISTQESAVTLTANQTSAPGVIGNVIIAEHGVMIIETAVQDAAHIVRGMRLRTNRSPYHKSGPTKRTADRRYAPRLNRVHLFEFFYARIFPCQVPPAANANR